MNLLLTGCFDYSDKQLVKLRSLGYNIFFMQYEKDGLPVDTSEIDAVVCNGLFLHHRIEDFTKLKFIQLTSVGFDRVPMDIVRERGISIFNARGVYSTPMAEWALFRALEFFKHGWNFRARQESKKWVKDRQLREISGMKVAVVGAGNIGQEAAKRFKAFNAETTGFDIHVNPTPGFDSMSLTGTLPDRVHEFDIIVLTAPLLPSTRGLVNKTILQNMSSGSMLINIARGGLIDEEALIETLAERKDLFAALDVFENEPLPEDSPLWGMGNVAISPHNSFVGDGNNRRMFDVIYNNLKTFIDQHS